MVCDKLELRPADLVDALRGSNLTDNGSQGLMSMCTILAFILEDLTFGQGDFWKFRPFGRYQSPETVAEG
jgi:hypothetical protein